MLECTTFQNARHQQDDLWWTVLIYIHFPLSILEFEYTFWVDTLEYYKCNLLSHPATQAFVGILIHQTIQSELHLPDSNFNFVCWYLDTSKKKGLTHRVPQNVLKCRGYRNLQKNKTRLHTKSSKNSTKPFGRLSMTQLLSVFRGFFAFDPPHVLQWGLPELLPNPSRSRRHFVTGDESRREIAYTRAGKKPWGNRMHFCEKKVENTRHSLSISSSTSSNFKIGSIYVAQKFAMIHTNLSILIV